MVGHPDAIPTEIGHSHLRRIVMSRVQAKGISIKDLSTQFIAQIIRDIQRDLDAARSVHGGASHDKKTSGRKVNLFPSISWLLLELLSVFRAHWEFKWLAPNSHAHVKLKP